jgi:tRNA nucleotidyltransferase/poly(A) polymerase
MTDQEHDEPLEGAEIPDDAETAASADDPAEAADAAVVEASADLDDIDDDDDEGVGDLEDDEDDDDPIEAAFDDDDFDDVDDDDDDRSVDASADDVDDEEDDDQEVGEDDDDDEAPIAASEDPPEIPLDQIDTDALWVVRRLRAKGHEAYLTGGCVRDLLLGREPKDFDVATAAHPDEVKKVFRNCRLIGRRFRLAHITFPGGKVIETATFRANPNDEADEEELEGDLLVERDNVFGNVEEDARRRDLTINGLFYDPIDGKVLDYVDGRKDLDARLIRTIGDPEIRFQEDPVRILRAIKFATRLGFDIEASTAAAMKHHVEELVRCAPARLQDEIQKLLLSGHAAHAFSLMEQIGVIDALMPELVAGLNDDGLAARELSEEEQEAFRDKVRRERRAAARAAKAAEEPTDPGAEPASTADEIPPVELDADAEPFAEATAADAAETAEVPEAPDAAAEPVDADVSDGDASDGEQERAAPEEAAADAEVVDEEPIEVPTHGAAPLSPAERRQRLEALLAALDQVRAREVQIASSVALGALLLPVWEAMRAAPVDEDAWLDSLGATWTERLRMTRRDRETIQRLMVATEELRPARRFGQSARGLVSRPWFREALLLYTLVLVAEGGDLGEVGAWKAIAHHYERPYRQPRLGEREPKPRRSRRRSAPRGRSRRRGGR